ncbi:restless-like transposase [Apiospora arundinis]
MVIASRASLEAQTIGICQVLRSWYRAGILPEKDNDILPLAPHSSGGADEASGLDWLESDGEVYSEASSGEDVEPPSSSSDSD